MPSHKGHPRGKGGQRRGTNPFNDHPGRNRNPLLTRDSESAKSSMATSQPQFADRYWISTETHDEAPEKRKVKDAQVPDRRKAANNAIENLMKLTSMGDAVLNYRETASPIWNSVAKSELSGACLKVIHEVPSAWSVSLEFLCQLVHEATHFYLLNSEKRNKHDVNSVDDAIVSVVTDLKTITEVGKSPNKCVELLAVLCRLFADLSQYNDGRPCMKNAYSESKLYFFRTIPAVKCVLELTDLLLSHLLHEAPELCTETLIAASKRGSHFVWVWLHVVFAFPSSIIRHLLWHGMQDFKTFIQSVTQCEQIQNGSVALKQQEEYQVKFMAIKDVLGVLVKRQNIELRGCALQMITNNLIAITTENGLDDMSILFMVRLMAHSHDILRFLIMDVMKLMNKKNIFITARMILSVDKKFVLNKGQTHLQFLTQSALTLRAFGNDAIANLIQHLQELAFEKKPDEFDAVLVNEISAGAELMLEEITNALLATHYADHHGKLTSNDKALRRYEMEGQLQQKAIDLMYNCERSRVFQMKLLHSLCVDHTTSSNAVSTLIARCICTAENEEQLAIFIAFLETVQPFNPDCLRKAISTKGTRRERKTMYSEISDFKRKNELWIRNMITLMEWEHGADSKQTMKYMRILMLDDWGLITNDVFSWALDSLSQLVDRRLDLSVTEEVVRVASSVTSFVVMSNQCGCSRVKYLYRLSAQICAMLVLILRFIGMERSTVVDAYQTLLECLIARFMNNARARTQYLTHLLDESFEISAELFGSCRNLCEWEVEKGFASGCDNFNLDPFGIFDKSNCDDDDILSQLNTLSCDSGRASQAAHSGMLARKTGDVKHRRFNPESDEVLRRLVFLTTLRNICRTGSLPQERFLFQHLAVDLSQRFCGDASLGSYMWGEWDLEKEQIAKYVKIAKNFNESGIAADLLTLIARERSLWYAYPVVKAVLAAVVNDIEAKSGRQGICRLSPETLLQVDRSFSFLVRAMILPAKLMCCMMKILARVTVHEASVLVINMWKYMSAVAPNYHKIFAERVIAAVSDYGRFGPKTTHLASSWRQSVTYLIQKYSKDLGRHVQLLKRESLLVNEERNDDWSIEYPPTYLVLPDMKRV